MKGTIRGAILGVVIGATAAHPALAACDPEPPGVVIDYERFIEAPATAVDGDTILFNGSMIHLWGIDAPEPGQLCTKPDGELWDCGERARAVLEALVGQRTVRCFFGGLKGSVDALGQQRAICHSLGADGEQVSHLNQHVLSNGWAFADPCGSSSMYCDLERRARERKNGIFSGDVMPPWDWRERGS